MNDIQLVKAILEHWILDYSEKEMHRDARRSRQMLRLIDKLCTADENEEEWNFIIDFLNGCKVSIDSCSPETMKLLSSSLPERVYQAINRIYIEQQFVHHVIGAIVDIRKKDGFSKVLKKFGIKVEICA